MIPMKQTSCEPSDRAHEEDLAEETLSQEQGWMTQESLSLKFKQDTKPVYRVLADHQATEVSWEFREFTAWLQLWAARFIVEFLLDVREVSLCVEWLRRGRLGHFRHGLNGFGLAGEIALNRQHLDALEPWEILGVLLHELLHAWQERHGTPGKNNYHNREFRQKAREYGLVVDQRGRTRHVSDSPFFHLLARYGETAPKVPPERYLLRGGSKLKKWSCGCSPPINVRVAVPHFYARCLWCGAEFSPCDPLVAPSRHLALGNPKSPGAVKERRDHD
jgi:hypothetical protein